jgi:alpha-beta hydrolase superfamily lysophospholipase
MPKVRTVTAPPPDDAGVHEGLAYTLWRPEGARGSVLVLHGAGSSKESHHPFARACRTAGLAALCFDQRGHGESAGALDAGALDDVAAMAELLPPGPRALRGSSMGGYLALVAAERVAAGAVVAICPAGAEQLRRGLARGDVSFRADVPALDALLAAHDADEAAARLDIPVLLLHAEGDERVPVERSRELARHLRAAGSRLIAVPGGHHRSIQQDGELQGVTVRWLARTLATAA